MARSAGPAGSCGSPAPADRSRTGPCVVVAPPAEFDLLTAPEVLSDIRRGLVKQPQRLIVDMSRVKYLGSKGIQVLLQANGEAERAGVKFQLGGVLSNGLVCRMLTIAGVIQLFDITDPATRPRDVAKAHPVGIELIFQNQFGRSAETACVTGGYCDEDTGHLRFVAVRPAGRVGRQDEWLIPASRIVIDGNNFYVTLPAYAVWLGSALSGAPEEIGGEIEDRLWRYYADVLEPTTAIRPTPISCSTQHCYRTPDVTDAIAQLMIRRRVIDRRSAGLWRAEQSRPPRGRC
jgi:anti-anti-sigma factor